MLNAAVQQSGLAEYVGQQQQQQPHQQPHQVINSSNAAMSSTVQAACPASITISGDGRHIAYINIQQYVFEDVTGATLINPQGVTLTQSDFSTFMLHARAVESMLIRGNERSQPESVREVATPRRKYPAKRKRASNSGENVDRRNDIKTDIE